MFQTYLQTIMMDGTFWHFFYGRTRKQNKISKHHKRQHKHNTKTANTFLKYDIDSMNYLPCNVLIILHADVLLKLIHFNILTAPGCFEHSLGVRNLSFRCLYEGQFVDDS